MAPPSRLHRPPLHGAGVVLLLAVICCAVPGNSWGGVPSQPPEPVVGKPPPANDVACPAYDASKLPAALSFSATAPAGALPGTFSVSPGGQATYRIPIAVPPGRLGMEPKLALAYDSGAGEGPLGVGFSLQGLSAITRCPANLAQDGAIAPVRYDDTDHFCLDGLRLVRVSPVSAHKLSTVEEYRTFPDSFSRIVAHHEAGVAGPASFTVHTRAGHVLEYGLGQNSRAMAKGSVVAAWHLATESDRRGNAVDYTYLNDTDQGDGHTREMLPLRVDYTRHGATPASRAVVLDWQTVPPRTLYSGGLEIVQSRRLQHVLTLQPGGAVVRTYRLAYDTGISTQRARIVSVEECAGASGTCKPPTTFTWQDVPAGFARSVTPVMVPAAQLDVGLDHRIGRWITADVNGDGLDDLVVSVQSTADPTKDDWRVALNTGDGFAAPETWATLPHPYTVSNAFNSHGVFEEQWTLTPIDLDQDGRSDIFLDTPDPLETEWPRYRWLQSVPSAPVGQRFVLRDTAIPQPPGVSYDTETDGPVLPDKVSAYRFTRLGDVSGDGVADLIECQNPTFVGEGYHRSPGAPRWNVHLWVPSVPGTGGPGFDASPIPIPGTETVDCRAGLYTLAIADLDGAAGSELLLPPHPFGTFNAYRFQNGSFSVRETNLPTPYSIGHGLGRRIHLLDLNGDGLSDAVFTGLGTICELNGCGQGGLIWGWPDDVPFQALNDGKGFGWLTGMLPESPVPWSGFAPADWYGDAALALDYDGDGRMDLAVPMDGHCHDGVTDRVSACWVVLRSNPTVRGHFGGAQPTGPTVGPESYASVIDTLIPFVVNNDVRGVPAHPWFLPQVIDAAGDGRHGLIMPSYIGDGTFVVYRSHGPVDLLSGVSDGTNPLSPGDPGFVPSVSIEYGGLVDHARSYDLPEDDAAAQAQLYLSRSDPDNGCDYPRSCVVGAGRVVSYFGLNDGQNRTRRFSLRYRDGRYHRLGRGSLGFGERIVLDEDAGSGTAVFYDNATWDPVLRTFPFAGQAVRSWAWSPASATQPKPTQIELAFTATQLQQIHTSGREIVPGGGITYFTLPAVVHHERDEGTFQWGKSKTLLDYVAASEIAPETVLSHTRMQVLDHDAFGNVLAQDGTVDGLPQYDTISREVENDLDAWLIGLVGKETACSSTTLSDRQCRVTTTGYDGYGEVQQVAMGDPGDPGTQLSLGYLRDAFGNVVRTIADDALGHHRSSCTSFEPEGIFPYAARNALGHTTLTAYDRAFGATTAAVDPNGLVTKWRHDGFGRITEADRADGTWASSTLTRHKDGGPQGKWWNVKVTLDEAGGASATTELDGAGRPVHTWTRASAVKTCGATACVACGAGLCLHPPAIEQETEYDAFGRVTRATVPWLGGDALTSKYADVWAYDAAGRVTRHTEPWGRVTTFAYGKNIASATDWLGTMHTVVDALGRTASTVDRKGNEVETTYGPFGLPSRVERFGAEATITTRDAYGRVIDEEDPDRGVTITAYDGFGEPLTIDDALGRHLVFSYDALGRLVQRDDHDGPSVATTTWVHDMAPHGVGRLASVASPAGHTDTYTYDPLSRPATHTLRLGDTGETFGTALDYDTLGRLWHVTYPGAPGVTPPVVRHDYDAFGRVIALHDDSTAKTLWQLQQLDGAGRAAVKLLGNGVVVTHAHEPATGLLHHVGAYKAQIKPALQDLTYTYDVGLRMTSRSDGLQKGPSGPATESFLHDALDRLTCASFAPLQFKVGKAPACATTIDYHDNGNIKSKGGLAYGYDPARPHAVTTVGSDAFAYDPVGNQKSRPGVTDIAYTAFDLPSTYTLAGGGVVTLDYDGDEHRIRKTTAQRETIYVDDLYERVTDFNGGVQHRYYVTAGSSTVVLTRAPGAASQAAYLLTEALGSVDVVAGDAGQVLERRSYDAFGAERHSAWGQPGNPPPPKVSPIGFTGHEGDDELGLVNMRGRIYDPKVARFLTTDPLVPHPAYSQSWNAYSYVWNSPLSFTDPSGFAGGDIEVAETLIVGKKPTMEQRLGGAIDLARTGAFKVVENGTGGDRSQLTIYRSDASGDGARARDAGRDDGKNASSALQEGGSGFAIGSAIGLVPGGGIVNGIVRPDLGPKTPAFKLGVGLGEVFGGTLATVLGATLAGGSGTFGFFTSPSGLGVGVGTGGAVVGLALAAAGSANVLVGLNDAADALQMSTGSPSSTSPPAVPSPPAPPSASPPVSPRGPPAQMVSNVTVTPKGAAPMHGTVNLKPTLDRIRAGGSFPHKNDGSIFKNLEGRLPSKPAGYYREWVHPTSGVSGPGPQRVITGSGGELFYTPDHYGTFIPLN